jgi:hypothetical protein
VVAVLDPAGGAMSRSAAHIGGANGQLDEIPVVEHAIGVEVGLAPRLHRLVRTSGGFTLHRHTARPVHHGIAVCADPAMALAFPLVEWHHDEVDQWVDRCRHHLSGGRGAPDDLHLGGWLEPRRRQVWLDVVRVFPTSAETQALALGRRLGQRAAFDLARSAVIPLAVP